MPRPFVTSPPDAPPRRPTHRTLVFGSYLFSSTIFLPHALAAPGGETQARHATVHAARTPHATTAPDTARGTSRGLSPAAVRAATPTATPPSRPEVISVSRQRQTPATRAEARLASIPGATSVIDAQKTLKGRNFTSADALSFQPGVFAQSSGGGDGLRLSIRGSGIATGTNYFRSGMLMMFDGLPVTTPAGTPYELFEPLGLRYTEVLRGANAFDYGGLQLGGAINYVTQTGYDAQKYQARVEAGSFGYVKEQVSSGAVIGKFDYFVSVTNSYRGGYQENTKATSFGINANFGYRFNDRVSTRAFFRYRQTVNGYPGYLTRDQILSDPKQSQSPYYSWGAHRIQPGTKYYGDMTTIRIDDASKIELGFNYQDAPIDIENNATSQVWGYKTVAGVLNYDRHDVLSGHKSDTQFGILTYSDLDAWQTNHIRVNSGANAGLFAGQPLGETLRHVKYGGTENYFHLRNNTEVAHNLWLTAAGALAFIGRESDVTYPNRSHLGTSSVNFIPRGGFRYIPYHNIEIYGNVSRSIQPPNDWNYNYAGAYYNAAAYPLQNYAGENSTSGRLRNQTATTFEIGTTGHYFHNKWSLSYYHSAVRNELLTVMTPQSEAAGTSIYGNASPTTHQGVEFSLETELLKWSGNTLSLRQAYTYQDFRYRHDAVFGHNRLPGIPEHFYQGEIHLDMHNGFYAGFDAQVSSKVGASYDMTYFAPSYHIYNANIGYAWPRKHREVFLSFNNLANKHYAAIVVPGYQSAGKQLSVMQPGDGFGVFAGVSMGFD
ncbi:TonB-dependent receptor domain-containing protein [Novacetimonas hansenii]|uniref:TonB-dependent receptor domain-containing protein n=1 Tax=Novacetimonas hansenii TaxID=436 RepID=UPI001CE0DFA7|nr:TonB-dependent receptor [Novacetimonas hansenii]